MVFLCREGRGTQHCRFHQVWRQLTDSCCNANSGQLFVPLPLQPPIKTDLGRHHFGSCRNKEYSVRGIDEEVVLLDDCSTSVLKHLVGNEKHTIGCLLILKNKKSIIHLFDNYGICVIFKSYNKLNFTKNLKYKTKIIFWLFRLQYRIN